MSKFDYSGCNKFPFRLGDSYRITKLQLACAVQGLQQLKLYTSAKQRLLNSKIHIATRYAQSAAYLLINPATEYGGKRKHKHPYSIENNSAVNLRPNDVIVPQ